MKNIKLLLFTLIVILISIGCRRDLGLDGPSGTYLYLNLEFPESDLSEGARFIHSDSDELTVSLTYPGETAIEVTFELTSTSPGSILVENIKTGKNVTLTVSVGTGAIPLAGATTTLDIVKGVNSPATLTLQAIDYTINGTLYDDADLILADHTFTFNGADVVTDFSGQFSFALSTAELVTSDYAIFEIINTETYELARTNLYLLQNSEDLSLNASPEIYMDFIVGSEQYVLPGTSYNILEGGEILKASGTADSNGRIFYQDSNYDSPYSHTIELYYNDMFLTKYLFTSGAPGAVVNDLIIDPYILFPHFYLNAGVNQIRSIQDMTGTGNTAINVDTIVASVTGLAFQRALSFTVDYLRGKMYLYAIYDSLGSFKSGIFEFDSWTDITPSFIDVTDTLSEINYSTELYAVPQMLVLDDGDLLVTTSYGAFRCDVAGNVISDIWEADRMSVSDFPFVSNGVYQGIDGTLFVLGVDRSTLTGDPDRQKIWQLAAGGTKTEIASIPDVYDDFPTRQAGFTDVSLFANTYEYALGLYEWNSGVVTLDVMDGSQTGGEIVFLTPSGSSWNLNGTPISQSPDSDPLDYVIPVGVLPDNKFYFIEEFAFDRNYLIRLDDPDTDPTEAYEYLLDGSGELQYYYNYFEASSDAL